MYPRSSAAAALLILLALAGPAGAGPPTETPIGAGCGEDGPTRSIAEPTVRLPASLVLRATGSARMQATDANQTAGAIVQLRQRGGRRVGGTPPDGYTCTDASQAVNVIALGVNAYGRRLVRRNGSLQVVVRMQLVNGSGVTSTVQRTATIRMESRR